MSFHGPEREPQNPANTIDMLRFFEEDLDQAERIELFRQAAERQRQGVDALATPENIAKINETFDIHIVFAPHGDSTDAGQIMTHIDRPFITFVEGTGATDTNKDPQFRHTVDSAFDQTYSSMPPRKSLYPFEPGGFNYARDRALMRKGSIILPIDIRHYAHHMLNAIIGDTYSQDYINAKLGYYPFSTADYNELFAATKDRGQLVMHSNAVRELTSAKQVMETLLTVQDDEKLKALFTQDTAEKIIALRDRKLREGKLPITIIYGSAHHAFMHEFRQRGIPATRSFANKDELPSTFSVIGSNLDQFFNAHHFEPDETELDYYANCKLLEDFLFVPSGYEEEYGITHKSRKDVLINYIRILKLARSPALHAQLPQLIADFKADKWVPVRILAENGIEFNYLDERP